MRVYILRTLYSLPLLIGVSSTPALAETSKLTLAESVKRTLERNSELESYSFELRAQDGRILQAGLIPNPVLSANPENFVGSKFFRQQIQNTIEISQLIELGGKRTKRAETAEFERERYRTEYEIKRDEILAELNLKFIQVLANQELSEVIHRSRSRAESLLRVVKARLKEGSGAGYEEPRTRVLLAKAKIEEEHIEHELLSSKKLLAAFWNSEDLNVEIEGDLKGAPKLPKLEELYEKLQNSPRLKQSQAELRLKEAVLTLEEAKRTPDLTVGLGWRYGRSLDDQTAVASISVPLQIFDRNQGNIAEAKGKQLSAAALAGSISVRLKAILFEIFQELKHVQTELEIMKSELIPQSEKALSSLEEGYKIGRYSLLELNESHNILVENQIAQILAAQNYYKLTIEITKLLGVPYESN